MNHKVALITGGSRGIGAQVALDLAKSGYHIVINYASQMDKANQVKEACEQYGVKALTFKAKVENGLEVQQMIDTTLEMFGRIDVLVNNSGITRDNLLLRMNQEDFSEVVSVNLVGAFNCIKSVTKSMMKQRSGVIINLSSVIGITGNVGQSNYAASKAGVIGLTKSVARELAGRNIRVNAIAPGFIQTDMTEALDESTRESIIDRIALKRLGEPSDVSELVAFLVSDKAKYITGQIIQVDGGMVI